MFCPGILFKYYIKIKGQITDDDDDEAEANTSAREKYLVERFYHRPAEEFYAVETDKEQFNNLAGNQIFERELEKHRNALDAWMKSKMTQVFLLIQKTPMKKDTEKIKYNIICIYLNIYLS